jgi:hypothetical protein
MKIYETLKIDTSFPDFGSNKLKSMLADDWIIIDKNIAKQRYLFYVLCKELDIDVGKCSYGDKIKSN